MKYNVTIQSKSYVVEIEDVNARPVIAYVEGMRFEVIPDLDPVGNKGNSNNREPAKKFTVPNASASKSTFESKEITAPLPGNVIEVFVQVSDEIETGQVILIIEAMKMKNSIRSTRAGKIAEVLVSSGQTVAHKQTLVRFEE